MSASDPRYSLDELAELGGVSRRTVRYYLQEALLPPPFGVGRGPHYGATHLDALVQVKTLQEAGRTLDEIRRVRHGARDDGRSRIAHQPVSLASSRSLWRRLVLAPGVELHVSSNVRLPGAAGLAQLATWCRTHLTSPDHDEED